MRVRASRLRALAAASTAALTLLTACGGGGYSSDNASAGGGKTNGVTLKVLIGSSGDTETKAVQAAGDAWGRRRATPFR